jgi:polysaccharide export outer membrane protein
MIYKKLKKLNWLFILPIFVCIQTSCSLNKPEPKNYLYFKNGSDGVLSTQQKTIIKKYDLLSIRVFSNTLNQDQAAIFNIVSSNGSAGGETENSSAGAGQEYEVNSDGNIELPVIGSIKAEGLTKQQLKESLILKLNEYIKLPNVTIRFSKFNINVIGEVRDPGIKNFQQEKVTLIDALSAAGDLTDFGRRENVTVIREVDNVKNYFVVDLRNKSVFQSPAYILQNNDIIYVEPNQNKLKTLSINPDTQRRTATILNITGILLTIATLVITINN